MPTLPPAGAPVCGPGAPVRGVAAPLGADVADAATVWDGAAAGAEVGAAVAVFRAVSGAAAGTWVGGAVGVDRTARPAEDAVLVGAEDTGVLVGATVASDRAAGSAAPSAPGRGVLTAGDTGPGSTPVGRPRLRAARTAPPTA